MFIRSVSILLLAIVLSGCVNFSESSATASREQIGDRISGQLHCQMLKLVEEEKDRFAGTGRNDTGAFTIAVTRQGENIQFHGVYLEPAHGTFSGSMSWTRHFNSSFGFHKTQTADHSSFGTP